MNPNLFFLLSTSIFHLALSYTTIDAEYKTLFQNLGSKAEQEFDLLFFNKSSTIAEFRERTVEWAKKYGILDQYAAFQSESRKLKVKIDEKIKSVLQNLPDVYALNQYTDENRTVKFLFDDKMRKIRENSWEDEYDVILYLQDKYSKNEEAIMMEEKGAENSSKKLLNQ